MITRYLQCSILLAVFFYFLVLLVMIKRKLLSLKYSLIWILAGILMALASVFPQIVLGFTIWVGMELPVNAVFTFFIFFLILTLLSATSIISKHAERVRILAQSVALLEKRIRELEQSEEERNKEK